MGFWELLLSIIKDQSRRRTHLCMCGGAWRKGQAHKYTEESCARPRMQQQVVIATAMVLVVMATGTALVGAECGLIQCRPVNVSMEVESCGIREEVLTTICAGNCYHQDPVYMDYLDSPEQRVCVGDWHDDKHLIQNCPVPVTFPRAYSCSCGPCATQYVNCEHFSHDLPSCLH